MTQQYSNIINILYKVINKNLKKLQPQFFYFFFIEIIRPTNETQPS